MARQEASRPPPDPEEQAFSAFYDTTWNEIYFTARRMIRHLKEAEDAEDVASRVFEKVWEKWTTLEPEGRRAYAYTALRNRVKDILKQAAVRKGIREEKLGDRPADHEGAARDVGRSEAELAAAAGEFGERVSMNPGEVVEIRAEAEEALRQLADLVPQGKEGRLLAWTLKRLEGYGHDQVAELLGISSGTSRNWVSWIDQLLEEKLRDNDQRRP